MIIDSSETSKAPTTSTNNLKTLSAKPGGSTISSLASRSSTKPYVPKKIPVQIPYEYTIQDLLKATTDITVIPIPPNIIITQQHLRNLTTNEAIRIGILVSFLPHSELVQLASYLTDEISHSQDYHYLINSLSNYIKTKKLHIFQISSSSKRCYPSSAHPLHVLTNIIYNPTSITQSPELYATRQSSKQSLLHTVQVDLSQTSKHITDNLTHIIQNSLKLPHSLSESVRELIFNNASWNNIALYETEEDDADSLILTTFPAHRDALLNYKQTRSLPSKYHFLAHKDN
jgi:hypothetical protein